MARGKGRGWRNDSRRHALAAKGVKTAKVSAPRRKLGRAPQARKGMSQNSVSELERMQRLAQSIRSDRFISMDSMERKHAFSEMLKIFQNDFPTVKSGNRYLFTYDVLDWAEVNLPGANYVHVTPDEAIDLYMNKGVGIGSFKAISKRSGRSVQVDDFWEGEETDIPKVKMAISYLTGPHMFDLGGTETKRDVHARSHHIFVPKHLKHGNKTRLPRTMEVSFSVKEASL